MQCADRLWEIVSSSLFLFCCFDMLLGFGGDGIGCYLLSDFLMRYYGKRMIILLDEYDALMQEAYVYGYWEEMAGFIRSLFNASFKTNPYLERAVMTGRTGHIGRTQVLTALLKSCSRRVMQRSSSP